MKRLVLRGLVVGVLALVICGLSGNPAWAQVAGNGAIQGTITDPSGGVVPQATVTALNEATGATQTRQSTSSGFYVLSPLTPGKYTITVAAKGFQKAVAQHVVVNALAVVGLNLSLKLGSTTQQVTVSAAPAVLNTTSGQLGVTIPSNAYQALPLAMSGGPKNPEGFIYLLPGVQNGSGFVGNINGGEAFSKEIYVNGLPLVSPELQGDYRNLTTATSVDAVEQFQVITNGSPAYYDGQGTENYVFKSGTNHFHGDAYEFVRNTSLDARGFFNAKTPIEKQNEFGVSAGGPILKNRLFVFGNFDAYRIRSGSSAAFYSLPTADERNGNFGALCNSGFDASGVCNDRDSNGNVINQIYNPFSTVCNAAGVCTRQPFANNVINIPLSSVSQKLQADLPSTQNNNLQNNFLGSLVGGTNQNDYTFRVDTYLSAKNHLYGVTQHGKSAPVGLGPNGGPQLPLPYTSSRFGSTTTNLEQLHDSYILSPSLVNVFAFSYNSFYTPFTNPTQGGGWASKVGLTGLPPGQAADTFPPISFGGPNSPTGWALDGYTQSFFDKVNTYTLQDNLQMVKGKHSVTVGGQIIFMQENVAQPNGGGNVNGFNFSNNETAGFDAAGTILSNTGNAYASYLLGTLDNASLTQNALGTRGARYKNFAFYVQDDYKATSKLTLNLGLRYVIPKPIVEAYNRMSWFNPTIPNGAVDGAPGILQFAGYGPDSCLCRTLIHTHYLSFGPRFGFAYQLRNNTVLRGAYGIFYYNAGALGGNATSGGTSTEGYAATPGFSSPDGGRTPAFNWNNGFPAYIHAPFFDPTLGTGYNLTAGPNGGGVTYGDPFISGRPPYTANYNFTVEHQFSPSTTLTVSYSGSNSHFLPTGIGRGIYSDQILPKYMALGNLLTASATPANIAAAQAIMPGATFQLPYPSFQGSIGQMLRPWPQYGGVGDAWPDIGNANYNSIQVAFQRRFSKGLQFLISYTGSKEIDNAGSNLGGFFGASGRTAYNNKLEKAVGGQDIPKQLVISYVYQLPFGKGRHFVPSNNVLNAIVSGWQFSGIQSYIQGTPINGAGAIGANCTVPYTGGCYANYNPNFSGPIRINGSYGSGNLLGANPPKFLDINAFQEPAPFTFGDTPRTLAYNLRTTPTINEDFSLRREIAIRENLSVDISFDAFNAFNRTRFCAPSTAINSSAFGLVGGQCNGARKAQFDAKINF